MCPKGKKKILWVLFNLVPLKWRRILCKNYKIERGFLIWIVNITNSFSLLCCRSSPWACGKWLHYSSRGYHSGPALQHTGKPSTHPHLAEGWATGGHHHCGWAVSADDCGNHTAGRWTVPLPGREWAWESQQLPQHHCRVWVRHFSVLYF